MVDQKIEKVEPKKEEVKVPIAQDFIEGYKQLCEKTGYHLVISPVWISTNHGSFELVLQEQVGELPK